MKSDIYLGFDDPKIARQYWINEALKKGYPPSKKITRQIISCRPFDELFELLSSKKEDERKLGTELLWNLWINEAGPEAAQQIEEGINCMEKKQYQRALEIFSRLIKVYPKFAEAYNKRAAVLYLMGYYENSIRDCNIVLKFNPLHFGAWHGMGLCLIQLKRYHEAIKSFQKTLEIQPYAKTNNELIEYCRLRILEEGK